MYSPEDLYICDHAGAENCFPHCRHRVPHTVYTYEDQPPCVAPEFCMAVQTETCCIRVARGDYDDAA